MDDWTHPLHYLIVKVHELCDRVWVWLQLDVLDQRIERHLMEEFGEGDGVLWACAGRCDGAGGYAVGAVGVTLSGGSMMWGAGWKCQN